MSNEAPVLERAVLPPNLAKRRLGRFAFVAASLGALGLAALGLVALRAPAATARVDVHVASTESPAPVPVIKTTKISEPGRIQVALLLDTSSSMGGLIDQARSQLWKIVTRLDAARRGGQRPAVEIALYEYGNSARGNGQTGWVRQITPFTTDLDRISEALFALDVSGGEEYVGQAITTALSDLQWSANKHDLKLLFVAGNEAFDQGPIAPSKAAEAARERGVEVTAILCGSGDPTWPLGTKEARFGYFEIDANQVVAHIEAPQDAEIMRLGTALNNTYMPFGAAGASSAARQVAQDTNSINSQPGSMVWRSVAKSSGSYDNSGWDLGDHYRNNLGDLAKLSEDELPSELRGLDAAQRKAYVEKKLAERTRLQNRIQELANERNQFIAKARTEAGATASLDSAMLTAVDAQAKAVGLTLTP